MDLPAAAEQEAGGAPNAGIPSDGKRPIGRDGDGDDEGKNENRRMHELRERWLVEQREVASRVVVLPDEKTATAGESVPFGSGDDRFELLRWNQGEDETDAVYYGGVDVSFPEQRNDGGEEDENADSVAVYVIVDATTKKVVYEDHVYFPLQVPYIPSFLAFREIDPLVSLVRRQQETRPLLAPSAILVDGNGVLHPRGAGVASFLGVRTGVPTIGVGKTLFCEGGIAKDAVLRGLEDSLLAAAAECGTEARKQLRGRGAALLFDNRPITGRDDAENQTHGAAPGADAGTNKQPRPPIDRGEMVKALGPVCCGLAVPLVGSHSYQEQQREDNTCLHESVRELRQRQGRNLAYALVGHGGKTIVGRGGKVGTGSKNPIYVSVGHNISLRKATWICASLCVARIPEPVRQADLIGRDLMRKKRPPST